LKMAEVRLPQKRYYRQRAHSNPIADHCFTYPPCPDDMDWEEYFPNFPDETKQVEFADIGCGYGGLLVTLSPMFPDTYMVGMEIRVKVSDYVQDRIKALRVQHPGQHKHIQCLSFSVPCLCFICHHTILLSLSKMFFLFPDPHFKKQKHKWRIISRQLLAEYAYVLRIQGLLYTITDVRELHEWMVSHLDEHPLFERVSDEDLKEDIVVEKLYESTEEGKKVTRNSGEKFLAVFRRVEDSYVPGQSDL
ncbi:tRNA (guanine-N(7)-)-methyltransferase, putative, partial [Ixodes scapularis]